jgi:5-(carboxyamino)imidazole ribonucleotide synthase
MMQVGVLGGGQLGQMLGLAGIPLDIRCRFLDPSADPPAKQAGQCIRAAYDDPEALARFAEGLDVATYEFENVPAATAQLLADRVPTFPPAIALQTAQDRYLEKSLFRELGIPVPRFERINDLADLRLAVGRIGLPAVLKTRGGGYDGKGQRVLRTREDAEEAWAALSPAPLILEEFISFERELSLIAVRSRTGETRFYPLVENHHREGILRLTRAPAPGLSPALQSKAEGYAAKVLDALEYAGVLTIELFERGGELLGNEMACRVHNSGHWTIEGAATSQFENHLRAILGLPLGDTAAVGHSAMVNLIGTVPELSDFPESAHVHLYGKEPRPGRKLGHVTECAKTEKGIERPLKRLLAAAGITL